MLKSLIKIFAITLAVSLSATHSQASTVGYDSDGFFWGVQPDIYGNKLGIPSTEVVAQADTGGSAGIGGTMFMLAILALVLALALAQDDPAPAPIIDNEPVDPVDPDPKDPVDPAPVVPLPGGLVLGLTGIGALVARKRFSRR